MDCSWEKEFVPIKPGIKHSNDPNLLLFLDTNSVSMGVVSSLG